MICALCCAFEGLFATAEELPAHHTAAGFRNNYRHDPQQSFWLWKWEQLRHGVPPPPPGAWKIPHLKTDAAALRSNRTEPTVTWIGRASFLIQLVGTNVLIDPHFSARASTVPFAGPQRIVPLPIALAELPSIDVVLITHNHYDHLDTESVPGLAIGPTRGALFLVPLGLKAWFHEKGIDQVEEYDWWQARAVGTLRFTLVPAQHWSRRTLWDTNQTLWGVG